MPWPLNGIPIIEPLKSSTSTRPSSAIVRVAVPVSSIAGPPGSCQLLTLASYVPAVEAMALCGAPGVPAFMYASISAFCSAVISGCFACCASAPSAGARNSAVAAATTTPNRSRVMNPPQENRNGGL